MDVIVQFPSYAFKDSAVPSVAAFPAGWNRHMISGAVAAMLDHEEEALCQVAG